MNQEEYEIQFPIYSTISLDNGFNLLIKDSKKEAIKVIGKVHSLFKRVINFKYNNQMYSILQKNLDNGPYSIRVNKEKYSDFSELNINIGDLVVLRNGYLEIEGVFKLKLDNKNLWSPKKSTIYFNENSMFLLKKNIQAYNQILFTNGNVGGVKYHYIKKYIQADVDHKVTLIEKELDIRISNFISGINNSYVNPSKKIFSLIGFGNGLTPSGDDFLTGFITALHFIKNTKTMLTFNKVANILENNILYTTDVSKAMIKASLEGKTRENLINFVYALFDNDSSKLIYSVDKIFSIGSSSGTDLSVGIIIGLMWGLNILENGGI